MLHNGKRKEWGKCKPHLSFYLYAALPISVLFSSQLPVENRPGRFPIQLPTEPVPLPPLAYIGTCLWFTQSLLQIYGFIRQRQHIALSSHLLTELEFMGTYDGIIHTQYGTHHPFFLSHMFTTYPVRTIGFPDHGIVQ